MTLPKAIVAALWIASIAVWLTGWEGTGAAVLRWVAPAFAIAHVIEFAVYRGVFAKAGGSQASHFLNTFVFGLFHVNEVKAEVEGEGEAA